MSFFIKASVAALKAFPKFNAELQGEELVLKYALRYRHRRRYRGRPRRAGGARRRRKELRRDRARDIDLATRARENKLALPELQGGTFTITNGGIFGSLLSTPILNTPQVGILGMHRIQERPVVASTGR
jgi:2-oxoglutarate dehydrogenase E2 component (dihydrolipoamide succinyltransferase)